MKQDIRTKTVLVIEKDGKYLSRREMITGRIVWDQHLSDSWRTRDKETALAVAELLGARPVLFNPIAWQIKAL